MPLVISRAEVAFRRLSQFASEVIVAKKDQDGGQVADELVERAGLDADALHEVRPHTIQYRVPELVIDNVGRQAGVDALVAIVEVVELQRLAGAIVERVLTVTGMRNDD